MQNSVIVMAYKLFDYINLENITHNHYYAHILAIRLSNSRYCCLDSLPDYP